MNPEFKEKRPVRSGALLGRLTHQSQMSDSFALSVILALSGGFQDAYTYVVRDEVFANAQTGNVVLMSTHLMRGDWHTAARYLLPLCAFIGGVLLAEHIRFLGRSFARLHWRQVCLLVEMGIMLTVGFMPVGLNLPANILVSFACALQVQSFRRVGGVHYASTMCIGNLRSGTEALFHYIRYRERSYLRRSASYFGVIFAFAVGAGVGGNLSAILHIRTLWVCCGLLAIGFLLMVPGQPAEDT